MYKDFNSQGGVQTCSDFMMNADTLFLAKKDLPVSDINPFTGKKLIQEKTDGLLIHGGEGAHLDRIQTQFDINKDRVYRVKGDIKNPDNWLKIEGE